MNTVNYRIYLLYPFHGVAPVFITPNRPLRGCIRMLIYLAMGRLCVGTFFVYGYCKSFYNLPCSNWQKTHFVIRIGFEWQNADVDKSKAGLEF